MINGTSGSIFDARPCAWRTASSRPSVSPLTSQITSWGRPVASLASAAAFESASTTS
jgi:hypothetical protein